MGPINSGALNTVWGQVGHLSCLTREEYDAYFAGQNEAHAIEIRDVDEFIPPFTLARLRNDAAFVPPQAWRWAPERLLELLGATK